MQEKNFSLIFLGLGIFAGLAILGYQLSGAIIDLRALERSVTVKGLAEEEVKANKAIWPIAYKEASNDLNILYLSIQEKNKKIINFLKKQGFKASEISTSTPSVYDYLAQNYTANSKKMRYTANSTVTVYTDKVDLVNKTRANLFELGKQGIALSENDYSTGYQIQFIYDKLNELKPKMVQTATKNARQVAEKFAKDSDSKLGKIKRARQGQFSISNRDHSTPYIKKVRVVSTLEYYLSD